MLKFIICFIIFLQTSFAASKRCNYFLETISQTFKEYTGHGLLKGVSRVFVKDKDVRITRKYLFLYSYGTDFNQALVPKIIDILTLQHFVKKLTGSVPIHKRIYREKDEIIFTTDIALIQEYKYSFLQTSNYLLNLISKDKKDFAELPMMIMASGEIYIAAVVLFEIYDRIMNYYSGDLDNDIVKSIINKRDSYQSLLNYDFRFNFIKDKKNDSQMNYPNSTGAMEIALKMVENYSGLLKELPKLKQEINSTDNWFDDVISNVLLRRVFKLYSDGKEALNDSYEIIESSPVSKKSAEVLAKKMISYYEEAEIISKLKTSREIEKYFTSVDDHNRELKTIKKSLARNNFTYQVYKKLGHNSERNLKYKNLLQEYVYGEYLLKELDELKVRKLIKINGRDKYLTQANLGEWIIQNNHFTSSK